jgi:hypothetical protein
MKKYFVLLLFVFVVGCSASVSESDRGRIKTMKDTRDGEVFSFNTDTVKNIKFNPISGTHSMTIITTDGDRRTLTEKSELYLKLIGDVPVSEWKDTP